jgi:ribosomal protein L27
MAGRRKGGGATGRMGKNGGKRLAVTRRKGEAKKRKSSIIRNRGKGRVRGMQSGGRGKQSSLTSRPTGRTLGVALAGNRRPQASEAPGIWAGQS